MLYETMNTLAETHADNGGRIGISLIGQSAPAAALRRMVTLSAATDAPLMLTGPLGSEKRDVAAAVHNQSDRSAAGFVAIHCASIDDAMLSGQLLDSASGGTVFFDEVSELRPSLHKHLYHLLQARNIRVISATSETVTGLETKFGIPAELYAGLSVLVLPIPPLAHRKADISLLLEAYIQQLPKEKRYTFDQTATDAVCSYDWPGNLDEMRDCVTRIAKRYPQQRISITQLPSAMQLDTGKLRSFSPKQPDPSTADFEPGFDLQNYLKKEEAKLIVAALKKGGGVVQRAANMTGIKRTTFLAKMKKYGIERASVTDKIG